MKNSTLLLGLPGNDALVAQLSHLLNIGVATTTIRQFPDGETYIKIDDDVSDKKVIIVGNLHNPDSILTQIYLVTKTLRDLGAKHLTLVTPYLAYMRQDTRFQPGEGVTCDYVAEFLSNCGDYLVTVDPHLHRHVSLDEVYTIPTTVVHATDPICAWITANTQQPLIIGPDSESKQWVSAIAEQINAPYLVLKKIRKGDREVEISIPTIENYADHTPVLLDDIISTGRTMIRAAAQITTAGARPPICIGVHAVCSNESYAELQQSTIAAVVTTNTIPHASNDIAMDQSLATALSHHLEINNG